MVTGWVKDNEKWFYMDKSGVMVTGWKLLNGDWYFFNESGVMVTGIQNNNSNLYYFKDSGVMATNNGWTKINDKWYYFENSGKIHTGWLKNNNKWYYLQNDGSMATGIDNIDGTTYMFSDNGYMETGWIQVNNDWYYFNIDGSMATGWMNIEGAWYYLDTTTGKMLANTTKDGYNIGADGKRYTALKTISLSTSSKTSDTNVKKIYSSVDSAAKKYSLDSKLILAIIKAESDFNPNATSSSGATGLMQIMPGNYTYLGISNGYDIDQNINGGAKLLKEYLSRFDGDIEIALAAYNAGPKSVEDDGVSSDDDLYKMSQGVQDYVKEVMGYYKNGNIMNGANLIET